MKKTKYKLTLVLSFLLSTFLFLGCPNSPEKKDAENEIEPRPAVNLDSSISAIDFAKNMECGWNLGNTLDARKGSDTKFPSNEGLSSETTWSEALTTEDIIKTGIENGYKTIRLPVTWCNHLTDKNYTIDSAWMARVKKIVDWAINAGYYVILNEHHSVHDNMSNPLKHCEGYILRSSDAEESKAFLKAIWTQISETFNNEYDEHLIFETMNEPRNTAHEHCWSPEPKTCEECKKDLELLNECNQLILDTIRASGGNNANRFVMIPANGTSIGTALTDDFKMPRDSASGKLMVTVHDYPLDSGGTGSNSHHFDTSTKNHFIDTLTALNDKYVAKGIPVVIGECGASRKAGIDWTTGKPVTDYVVTYDDRLNCFSYLASLAGKYSMPLINWDCGGKDGMATINRENCSVFEPEYNKAVIKAWQDANKNPSSVSIEIKDEEIDLTQFKVWDTNVSSYNATTKLVKLGSGFKGGDVYFGEKPLSNFSQLKITYKNASADFTVTLGYTDSTEEKVTASAASSSVTISLDKKKIAKIIMLMSKDKAVSFELEEIKFSK